VLDGRKLRVKGRVMKRFLVLAIVGCFLAGCAMSEEAKQHKQKPPLMRRISQNAKMMPNVSGLCKRRMRG